MAEVVGRLAAVPGREGRLTHLEVLPARSGRAAPWPAWADPAVVTALPRPRGGRALAAPGRDRGRGVRRPARRPRHRHRLRQVARLPAAGAELRAGHRAGPAGAAAPPPSISHRPRRWPRTSSPGSPPWASTSASPPTTATAAATSASGPATTPSTCSPTPTCCTTRCCPATSAGAPSSPSSATSWSTSATTTAASSGRTSPRCCVGCAGSARRTAPSRRSCSRPPPSPSPRRPPARLTGLDVLAVTGDCSPRGEVSLAMWQPALTQFTGENGAPLRRAASSEAADLLADLVAEDVRTLAFIRSRRGAEQVAMHRRGAARRGRPVAARDGSRPTAAATCPRSAASSSASSGPAS